MLVGLFELEPELLYPLSPVTKAVFETFQLKIFIAKHFQESPIG